jgi:NADPH-dependent 2,4-dienoyl-CoA reductase/sulfur reductase-like enzyme/rhodanese-related sulfurtransferase
MAACAYPYYAGGTVKNRAGLFSVQAGSVRDTEYYLKSKNIIVKTGTEVTAVNPEEHTVAFKNTATGETGGLTYTKLIIASGAFPRMPDVPGVELDGVTALRSLQDADYLKNACSANGIKNAVILGGGSIGLEVCEAIAGAGSSVTIVEAGEHIMNSMDPEMSLLIEKYLRGKNISIITNCKAVSFTGTDGRLSAVKLDDGSVLECELAVVAMGVIPDTELAKNAGIMTGTAGGIIVNQHMQTSNFDIYAAGDCVESRNFVSGINVYAPLGDAAAIQGRIAGDNAAAGNKAIFTGTAQSTICKVFDFVIGSTGLTEKAALAGSYEIETAVSSGFDKPLYMGGKTVITKLVMERFSDRILGVQSIGTDHVSRLIAAYSTAIKGGLGITDMCSADFPYAPPFSPPVDPGITAVHVLENKIRGLMKSLPSIALKEKLDAEHPFILDVRTAGEFNAARLAGAVNIPLSEIRDRLGELPEGKKTEIICYCQISLRAYEAARILMQKGWRGVKVLEGGLAAWPYPLETA